MIATKHVFTSSMTEHHCSNNEESTE